MPIKRHQADLERKAIEIGELIDLEKVPKHILAWKEPRLEIGDADCYPIIDVLHRIATMLSEMTRVDKAAPAGKEKPRKTK